MDTSKLYIISSATTRAQTLAFVPIEEVRGNYTEIDYTKTYESIKTLIIGAIPRSAQDMSIFPNLVYVIIEPDAITGMTNLYNFIGFQKERLHIFISHYNAQEILKELFPTAYIPLHYPQISSSSIAKAILDE